MVPSPLERAKTPAAVGAWFALNIAIGNLNGWILKHHAFRYPVLLTTAHMLVCYALSALALATAMPPEAPRPLSPDTDAKIRSLALAFCASVALGNVALRFIYVSFAQMVTAASPLMTIALVGVMTGKRYSRGAYLSMLPMCGGVMLCTAGELNFHWLGFVAVVASTLLRGVKTIIQGRLLTEPEDRLDAMSLLYHMSKSSVLPLGLYAALVEYSVLHDPLVWRGGDALRIWALVLASAVVSFLLNLCNFLVTQYTSAVMLQVLGNVKVVGAIVVSVLIFGNAVSAWSALGLRSRLLVSFCTTITSEFL